MSAEYYTEEQVIQAVEEYRETGLRPLPDEMVAFLKENNIELEVVKNFDGNMHLVIPYEPSSILMNEEMSRISAAKDRDHDETGSAGTAGTAGSVFTLSTTPPSTGPWTGLGTLSTLGSGGSVGTASTVIHPDDAVKDDKSSQFDALLKKLNT